MATLVSLLKNSLLRDSQHARSPDSQDMVPARGNTCPFSHVET